MSSPDSPPRLHVRILTGLVAAATPSTPVSQPVQVRTHKVQVRRLNVPTTARAGKTVTIAIGISNRRSTEQVEVALYGSVPTGDFVLVASASQSVPVRSGNGTTDYRLNHTLPAEDAAASTVTFKAVATIIGHRDAIPADNTALSLPVSVRP